MNYIQIKEKINSNYKDIMTIQTAGESVCMGNQSARLSLKQLETTQDLLMAKATMVCG